MLTDLQVFLEVVEQNHLQHQLLSSDDVGRKVQGQEEVLEHCELQEKSQR